MDSVLVTIAILVFVYLMARLMFPSDTVDTSKFEETSKLNFDLAQSQLRLQQQSDLLGETHQKLVLLQERFEHLQGQKKSSEVKVGYLAEALAPLHESFPVPPETCRFLGAPFDFVSFDLENERIVFIECKSNGSVLSPKQRKLKQLILDGKVEFAEVRIGKDGVTSKVSSKV